MGITKILTYLVVLALTVMTLVFIGGYITGAFSGTKEAEASSELSTIIANVQGLYASQPSFSGLTNTVAIQGGVYPSSMATQNSTEATDPWGGQVSTEDSTSNTNEFTVEFNNVPQDSCTKLASSYNSSNLVSLSIGGNDVTAFDPATLSAACQTATSSGPTSLIWTLN
jgi:hypothetical protein